MEVTEVDAAMVVFNSSLRNEAQLMENQSGYGIEWNGKTMAIMRAEAKTQSD